MGVAESAGWLLMVFYAGAVVASGRCWIGVLRGHIRYPRLRDITGIGDRAALRRCFGLASKDGFYRVTLADVVRWRRPAGLALTNVPAHLLFLLALAFALNNPGSPAFLAVLCAASAHALVVATSAASILVGGRPLAE
jgi:hypothetical protein